MPVSWNPETVSLNPETVNWNPETVSKNPMPVSWNPKPVSKNVLPVNWSSCPVYKKILWDYWEKPAVKRLNLSFFLFEPLLTSEESFNSLQISFDLQRYQY